MDASAHTPFILQAVVRERQVVDGGLTNERPCQLNNPVVSNAVAVEVKVRQRTVGL